MFFPAMQVFGFHKRRIDDANKTTFSVLLQGPLQAA